GVLGSDGALGAVGGAGSDGGLGGLGGLGAVGLLLTPAQAAVPLRPRASARSFFDRATLVSCIGMASSYDMRRRPPVRHGRVRMALAERGDGPAAWIRPIFPLRRGHSGLATALRCTTVTAFVRVCGIRFSAASGGGVTRRARRAVEAVLESAETAARAAAQS